MGDVADKHNLSEKIRNAKPFHKKDLLVYGILLCLLIGAFLGLLLKNDSDRAGFNVFIRGEKAFTYYYGKEYSAEEKFAEHISFDAETKTLTVYFNAEKTEYNVLKINDEEKKVTVISSTCDKHDCEHMENNIYCAPHFLKVTSIEKDKDLAVG